MRTPILVSRQTITIVRQIILVSRQTITINRCSITQNYEQKRQERSKRMMAKIQQERNRLGVVTKADQSILDVVHYYEYKCRKVTGNWGWKAIGRNFREHRNWKHFTRIYELCVENHWDYKVYVDSQFDRVRFWRRKQDYPFPNQCYSENAVKSFHAYCKDYQERFSVTGNAKIKTSEVKNSYRDEVIDAIITDCEHFTNFFKVAPKQRKYKGLTPEQMKFMYVIDHVATLSQYYWASLPWAVTFLQRFSTPWVIELTTTVANIQQSQSRVRLISQIVTETENQLGIPHTILPDSEVG